jgi:hypothetical protein
MLRNLLGELGDIHSFHHGDCVGADAEAHDSVRHEFPKVVIVIHPPAKDTKRAFKKGDRSERPKQYLARNRDIARACQVLIATPKQDFEVNRSGTWSTVRYAREYGKKIYVILPDGEVVD